ncbi:hypothetical protein [Streptomyces sp. NPDC006334]|uniref:hypothetical protein n=1 Tax=Streptomyces sp. NPDC006334 TaxID=3156754 RepID=UPI0033A35251
MELPAENKRTAVLALALLGALLAVSLTVFTVFDGDDGDGGGGDAARTATGGQAGAGSGSGSGSGTSAGAPSGGVAPIVEPGEVAEAHGVMAAYMAGVNTYDHTSGMASWSPPLLALTSRDVRMRQATVLPSGKAWDNCKAEQCSSKGTAVVVRDAVISDDLVRGSGRSISSLVKVTATRSGGGQSSNETNQWLVTVQEDGGRWKVSGFDVFGLGDVGASDQSGE